MTIPSTDTKYVGIWIRVSTEDQAQGESPEHHERRARAYAEAKGWHVETLYDLSGVSGKSVMEHPECVRMLADIREGAIDALIFSKLARLARNTRELLDFADIFREHDADLVSLSESIDTSTPAGRLFFTMVAAMAQWEREEISERVAASVPIRAKLGKNVGGQASFGYRWQDNQLVIDADEAPVRKLIYELFVEHKRKKTVARLLNEQGYRTRKGRPFSDTTIERLLRDPTAKGERRANYTKSLGRGKAAVLKPESEWLVVPCEAIVAAELWEQCNTILDEQRTSRKPPAKKAAHLFGGLTFCHCGQKMYVKSNSPKYVCSKCKNKIPIVDLDGIFHEQLKTFFFSDEEIAEYLLQSDQQAAEKRKLISVLEKERRDLQSEMERLHQLHAEGEIPTKGFGERYRPLYDRAEQIAHEIPKLQAELDIQQINLTSKNEIVAEARDLYSNWPNLPFEQRRQIVETITESIVIGANDIEINLHYVPEVSGPIPKTESNGKSATHQHGFMAAMSWMREG